MGFVEKWRAFWSPKVALAFDRDTLWCVADPAEEPTRVATCVALDERTRKVVACGEEAEDLRAAHASGVVFVDYVRNGGLGDFDVAEAALRSVLRARRTSAWAVAPRVLVATSRDEVGKRALKDAVIHAGARDVVTIPRTMAAAIGIGIDVARPELTTIIYLDRDWSGFAVIGRSDTLAWWEAATGLEEVAAEKAWRERGPGDAKPRDLAGMLKRLAREGAAATDADCAAFFLRMREHCLVAAGALSEADARAAAGGALYLVGPYAKMPGLRDCLAGSWGRAITVPEAAEAAVILGCRKILGELDDIVKSAISNPASRPGAGSSRS